MDRNQCHCRQTRTKNTVHVGFGISIRWGRSCLAACEYRCSPLLTTLQTGRRLDLKNQVGLWLSSCRRGEPAIRTSSIIRDGMSSLCGLVGGRRRLRARAGSFSPHTQGSNGVLGPRGGAKVQKGFISGPKSVSLPNRSSPIHFHGASVIPLADAVTRSGSDTPQPTIDRSKLGTLSEALSSNPPLGTSSPDIVHGNELEVSRTSTANPQRWGPVYEADSQPISHSASRAPKRTSRGKTKKTRYPFHPNLSTVSEDSDNERRDETLCHDDSSQSEMIERYRITIRRLQKECEMTKRINDYYLRRMQELGEEIAYFRWLLQRHEQRASSSSHLGEKPMETKAPTQDRRVEFHRRIPVRPTRPVSSLLPRGQGSSD